MKPGLARLRESWPAIVQIVVAATGAYAFSVFVLGHSAPLLTTTVTISSLGLVRDARPRVLAETLAGMVFGVLVAEVLRFVFGAGWWQLGLALALTLAVARFLSPQPWFAIAAAIQSGIVIVIPGNEPFARLADALVGAVAALLVTALLPRSARSVQARDGRALFAAFDQAAGTLAQALRRGDPLRAARGLETARATNERVDTWRASLDSGREIARISPFLARERSELARHADVLAAMDLAVRNLRVVARRVVYVVDDGQARPVAAGILGELQRGAALVSDALDDISLQPVARAVLVAVARRLDPVALMPGASHSDQNVIAAMRPLAVDLLTATGMSSAEARAALPRV
ncbi:FUSC family protein [Microbacterium sp. W1N]|uniref:FUSC family protein n=1 Tax=Microbacterium festucae TaxID=2977531 RepID=UPI0021BF6145|nr:FUSC family protein [Microbacterium festucae]MCT9821059.1 FUSC family protein [Microbacterium festucae]